MKTPGLHQVGGKMLYLPKLILIKDRHILCQHILHCVAMWSCIISLVPYILAPGAIHHKTKVPSVIGINFGKYKIFPQM